MNLCEILADFTPKRALTWTSKPKAGELRAHRSAAAMRCRGDLRSGCHRPEGLPGVATNSKALRYGFPLVFHLFSTIFNCFHMIKILTHEKEGLENRFKGLYVALNCLESWLAKEETVQREARPMDRVIFQFPQHQERNKARKRCVKRN